MSVESAVAYIKRMRADEEFHRALNDNSEDEAANWAAIKAAGYDFTMVEFRKAQEAIYQEFGVTPIM